MISNTLTENLWTIYNEDFSKKELISPEKNTVDVLANISLGKLLFEHTLLNEEFLKKPKKYLLRSLVEKVLEEFPSLTEWLEKQQEGTVLFVLWLNYKLSTQ